MHRKHSSNSIQARSDFGEVRGEPDRVRTRQRKPREANADRKCCKRDRALFVLTFKI